MKKKRMFWNQENCKRFLERPFSMFLGSLTRYPFPIAFPDLQQAHHSFPLHRQRLKSSDALQLPAFSSNLGTLENAALWNLLEQRRGRGSDLLPGARGFHHVLCTARRVIQTHILLPFLIIVTECLTAFYRKRSFQLRICGSALGNACQAEPSLWQCGLEAWLFPILVS